MKVKLNFLMGSSAVADEMLKYYKVDLDSKLKTLIAESVESMIKDGQKEWKDDVTSSLNTPVSPAEKHKRRFYRKAEFPKRDTGELRDSVGTRLELLSNIPGKAIVFRAWFDIISKHRYFTNEGINSSDTPGWVGWVDDVFYKKKRGYVVPAKDMVKIYFQKGLKQVIGGSSK